MEISVLALIGISLATMFFGYFFGLFEGRGQGYKRGRKEEALSRKADAPPASPSANSRDGAVNVGELLVLRQDRTGKPAVEIDGMSVAANSVSPSIRKRLIDLMVMLRPWIEPPGPSTQAGSSPDQGPASVAASRTASPPPAADALGDLVQSTAEYAASANPAGMSLVQQIDQVLQARLAGTSLAGRGIRLAEAPHGGAIVFIGQVQHDGVDQVADPEIQAAIRSAIAEWEQRYSPH